MVIVACIAICKVIEICIEIYLATLVIAVYNYYGIVPVGSLESCQVVWVAIKSALR